MARKKISNELWKALQPLLPVVEPSTKGGRPRVDDRAALNGILFVLHTGIPWEDLPKELGFGSGMTCWRRLRDWQADGVCMRSSMSRKGNCWDNAPTESLWGSLKVARLHGRRFPTRREAMDEVIDWLSFYNHRRLHSTLGYLSPMQFERAWLASQQQRAA